VSALRLGDQVDDVLDDPRGELGEDVDELVGSEVAL